MTVGYSIITVCVLQSSCALLKTEVHEKKPIINDIIFDMWPPIMLSFFFFVLIVIISSFLSCVTWISHFEKRIWLLLTLLNYNASSDVGTFKVKPFYTV